MNCTNSNMFHSTYNDRSPNTQHWQHLHCSQQRWGENIYSCNWVQFETNPYCLTSGEKLSAASPGPTTTKLFFCFQTHCWCWRFVDGFSPSSSDLLSQHCFKQRKLFTLTEGFWRPDSPGRRMRCGTVCLAFWWSCGREWWTLLPSPSREDTSTVLMQHLQAPFSCVWAGDDKWERTHISPLRSSHSFWASNGFTSVSSSPSIRPRTESIVF